jgi:hypothetical protein
MRWHQHIQIVNGKWVLWVNHPGGDADLYRGARISAFQLVVFWVFAEIVCVFGAAPEIQLSRLRPLADQARQWLSTNEVFFHGEKWEVQLMPFVYPTSPRYWDNP